MKRKITTTKLLILIAVFVVLVISGYFFAFWYMQGQIAVLATLNNEVEKDTALDTSLSSLQAVLHETETEAAMIDSYYVSSHGIVSFISEIETLARDSGLTIKVEDIAAQQLDKESKELIEKVVMRLETNGSWRDTYQFLTFLEHLPYHAVIDGANIERRDSESGAVLWKGDFILTVLKLK